MIEIDTTIIRLKNHKLQGSSTNHQQQNSNPTIMYPIIYSLMHSQFIHLKYQYHHPQPLASPNFLFQSPEFKNQESFESQHNYDRYDYNNLYFYTQVAYQSYLSNYNSQPPSNPALQVPNHQTATHDNADDVIH